MRDTTGYTGLGIPWHRCSRFGCPNISMTGMFGLFYRPANPVKMG